MKRNFLLKNFLSSIKFFSTPGRNRTYDLLLHTTLCYHSQTMSYSQTIRFPSCQAFHHASCLLWSGIHYYHIEILASVHLRSSSLTRFLISTQVSPLYSLHVYDNVAALLLNIRFLHKMLLRLSIQHGIILTIIDQGSRCQQQNTVINSACLRTSTVLGRFYYGISRHSIQFGLYHILVFLS